MKKVLGITLVLVTCVLLGVSAQGAKEQVVKPLEFSVFYSDNATLPFRIRLTVTEIQKRTGGR